MSGICFIVCAGPIGESGLAALERDADDLLIAVDGGFAHCVAEGIEPDLFIGDLDSLDPALVDSIACERIELPRAKDDTDTLYACKEGLARGYTRFALFASLGGDVGHEIANIQTLAFLAEHDAQGTLLGDAQLVSLVTPAISPHGFEAPIGTRVSVFAFGGIAKGVVERGLEWELEDASLSPSYPVGVSNRSTRSRFEIGVAEGALLVIIGQ